MSSPLIGSYLILYMPPISPYFRLIISVSTAVAVVRIAVAISFTICNNQRCNHLAWIFCMALLIGAYFKADQKTAECGSKIENSVHNNAEHTAMKIRFVKIENFTTNNKSNAFDEIEKFIMNNRGIFRKKV